MEEEDSDVLSDGISQSEKGVMSFGSVVAMESAYVYSSQLSP